MLLDRDRVEGVYVVLKRGVGAFVATVHPSEDAAYTETASSVRGGAHTNVTNGQVMLRMNNVSDASDPATAAVWASLNLQAYSEGVYYRALTPSPGEKNLIANITVTNARSAAVPFTYIDFVIVGRAAATARVSLRVRDAARRVIQWAPRQQTAATFFK